MANIFQQIEQLKRVVKKWKLLSSFPASSSPGGYLAVYVGAEQERFLIPTRFLNLPIFKTLLRKAEEAYGFNPKGGLTLPFEADLFREMLKNLEREHTYGCMDLDEFLKMMMGPECDNSSCS